MVKRNKHSQYSDPVGARLKQLRQRNGWSLDKASQATEVSKAMLGQIERGESSPTVATLWKIATGFEVPLSSLIEDNTVDSDIRHGDHKRRIDLGNDKTDAWTPLFPFDPKTGIEVFVIDLPAGHEHLSSPHQAGVTEYIMVLSGQLDIQLDNTWQTLKKGEALRFNAQQQHGYRNKGRGVCSFHNVIHYS